MHNIYDINVQYIVVFICKFRDICPSFKTMFLCVQVMATVQKAIENLARGAVFVEQARIDETIYSHEETSYRTHFEDVENQGIYWLMCEMQKFLAASGRWVNSDVTRDIMSIQIRDITTRSNRHVRDYIILRDLQKILYKVNVDFSMLKERVAPRRTSRR